jgi:hypothetical protein
MTWGSNGNRLTKMRRQTLDIVTSARVNQILHDPSKAELYDMLRQAVINTATASVEEQEGMATMNRRASRSSIRARAGSKS